jgi:hypothetical protein
MDAQTTNPETGETKMETVVNNKPGFLTGMASGLEENYNTPFNVKNLYPVKKGVGQRIGEGLGSWTRILATTGGDAYTAGTQGLEAAMKRQNIRTSNQLYRNALEAQGIDTSNINGVISDDAFKNYSLANYRNRNLDIKLQLETLKDTTKRAQLVNLMLTNGSLDPLQAMELMNNYGIDVNALDESNQTKLVPFKQYALKNGWNLGWANFGLKATEAAAKAAVIKELVGGDTNQTQTVRVKAPNGKTGTIPIEQLEGALAAGYTRI